LNEDPARRVFTGIVRRDHSFNHRAAVILAAARALLAGRDQHPVAPK
jgi:hypothetical protein